MVSQNGGLSWSEISQKATGMANEAKIKATEIANKAKSKATKMADEAKNKAIIIVCGEPRSIFLEIFFKSLNHRSYKSPLILISSLKLFKSQMKKFNFKRKINLINYKNFDENDFDKRSINFIDVELNISLKSKKITNHSNLFIKKCFDIGLNLIKQKKSYKFINGPISKKNFVNKKFPGMTEYISN